VIEHVRRQRQAVLLALLVLALLGAALTGTPGAEAGEFVDPPPDGEPPQVPADPAAGDVEEGAAGAEEGAGGSGGAAASFDSIMPVASEPSCR
jgi:hypothetical protein